MHVTLSLKLAERGLHIEKSIDCKLMKFYCSNQFNEQYHLSDICNGVTSLDIYTYVHQCFN